MSDDWREELVQKMAQRIDDFIKDTTDWRKVLAVEIARNLCINKKDFDTLDWGAKEYFLTQARTALAVAEPVIREECARIADEEANAMEEQLDNIIEKGTLGGRLIPNKFKRIFAHERKILIEGYEQIAAAIREGKHD